ncbi:MAG: N-acetyltransferase [Pirellulales bacterium]|nr:N-acetyltransferase [Pirellulales bacterium]
MNSPCDPRRPTAEVVVRSETPADASAVRVIDCAAFETPAEAALVDALRAGGYVLVSLVAEVDGEIIGHIVFSRMTIERREGAVPAAALAPVAVTPAWQRRGVGSRLVVAGLEACRDAGERIAVVLGHPEFYPRFGFTAELAAPLAGPFTGPAWMACELVPGALAEVAGQVRYAPPFGIEA